ncbi:MAG: hypothetical protein LHV68_09610 [Elusimicrobia bacterium]|nr:hypothetical protein [Candidatus Liberimonas magnetica]
MSAFDMVSNQYAKKALVQSGDANGFTKKEYYKVGIDDEYFIAFNEKVKNEFEKEAKNGKVGLDFNRLYYIGEKT